MKEFTVYDPATGEILRSGYCQALDFEHQAKEGESIVEGRYDVNDHYLGFENGKQDLIPIAKAAKPSQSHNWDTVTKTWVGDIMAARAAMRDKIQAEFKNRANLPIAYDGNNWDADFTAHDNIQNKLLELDYASTDRDFKWRDADNNERTWGTKIGFRIWLRGLISAISGRKSDLYATAWAHKDALQSLSTVSDVEDYDYTTGW